MKRVEEFLGLKRELLKKHEKEMEELCISFATRKDEKRGSVFQSHTEI